MGVRGGSRLRSIGRLVVWARALTIAIVSHEAGVM